MTSGFLGAMLSGMAVSVVLGLSIIALFIIGGGILMFVLAGVAIFKMRKDEFWDEPPG